MDKSLVHRTALQCIENKIHELRKAMNDTLGSVADDTKSTAGDKHETSRAMAQLELEKIGLQLSEAEKLRDLLLRIDPTLKHQSVQAGSLVKTNLGWFYYSVALGQIEVNEGKIFCLTPIAPLGKALLSKKAGQEVEWQGKKVLIDSVA